MRIARASGICKQLDVDALRQFRATWEDGPQSAQKNLERLRSFLNFCQQAGWIEKNPAKALKPPKLPEKSSKVKVFSAEEITRFSRHATSTRSRILTATTTARA